MRMNACQHTGISVPECSCRECLQALTQRHAPSLLAHEAAKQAHAGTSEVRRPSEQPRRAA